MAYSIDYIKRAVEYKDEGHTFKELREIFKIPPQTYYNWTERLACGEHKQKLPVPRFRKIDKQKLEQMLEDHPDAYLAELAAPFNCSAQAVFYALKKNRITVKKNFYLFGKI